jgi:type II secretory pathway component PulF
VRTVNSPSARNRVEPVVHSVREGRSLSSALESVARFPVAISRLAAVGEISVALGPMLARGGNLKEDTTVRRLEAVVRVAGPALIVGLGGLIGLLMASLLSGVSEIGQSALQ